MQLVFQANLRACNEELRLHVTDLQQELELQRNSVNMADRQKVLTPDLDFDLDLDFTNITLNSNIIVTRYFFVWSVYPCFKFDFYTEFLHKE